MRFNFKARTLLLVEVVVIPLLYRGRRGIAEFTLKIGKINMQPYDNLPKFRGIAEFGFENRGKILPLL